MIAVCFTAETFCCGFVKVFDFHDWKQWNLRNVIAEVQNHKKMNHHVSMHLWNHSSAFKRKASTTFIYSAFAAVVCLVLWASSALTTGGSKPLIKYLCKDSASVNIEQQGEPLPPFFKAAFFPRFFFKAPKQCLIMRIPECHCIQWRLFLPVVWINSTREWSDRIAASHTFLPGKGLAALRSANSARGIKSVSTDNKEIPLQMRVTEAVSLETQIMQT